MDSLKEALLNILDLHSEIFTPFENKQDNSNDEIAPEIPPPAVQEEPEKDGESDDESSDVLSPLSHPFLPNFNDEMMKVEYSDSDSDSDDDMGLRIPELAMEPESEGIFKVWELDIPVEEEEEDELVKELEEALSGGRVPKRKDLKLESVDSLIDNLADLSIK
ncbi:hypothetical protein LXL04_025395 [Taraxacum kok-saghyz]